MVYRLIAPDWLIEKHPELDKVAEGQFTEQDLKDYNEIGYNIYYFPNYPNEYQGGNVNGTHIDKFEWVFVDCDLKDGVHATKKAFLILVAAIGLLPTKIVDSGNGIHVYWRVSDLEAKSYLRIQRRLLRMFNTDPAVGKICQLMRLEGYDNTKDVNNRKLCYILAENVISYTCEDLDRVLHPISLEDEQYCVQHYNKTYQIEEQLPISGELPPKFGALLRKNKEVKELFTAPTDDRSKNDYRLGHIMLGNGFTKEEALNVLYNSAKAMQRAPTHRYNYAQNIVDKIWTFEEAKETSNLSASVFDILQKSNGELEGQRFPCFKYIDNTECGFRLGHVLGLVAGSGVGKTAIALNIFMGFVTSNPEYVHFFCPLEQTNKEVAARWAKMCGTNMTLHNKVHIISNYDENGNFRDLSLGTIKEYIKDFKTRTGQKVGCVVIDHIGILCNNNKLGQDEGVKQIAKAMKSFAIETDTFLIMQSQTSRSKAGIGDIELDKDSAFGTSVFENFCDFLVTSWQPLKRVYAEGAPTITAIKFCKIRHKNQTKDAILEDKPYALFFDPNTQLLRELTQTEETSFKFYLSLATNRRKIDKKTELVQYTSVKWEKEVLNVENKS